MENEILFYNYSHISDIPRDEELIAEFRMKNPHCDIEKLRIFKTDNSRFIYQDRNAIPIKIEGLREDCFGLKNEMETSFIHSDKDGSTPGYCKFSIRPYPNANSILITNHFTKGEKFRKSTERIVQNKASLEVLQEYKIHYFQYLAETIIGFCKRYKIIETQFSIDDLIHHVIDTNPARYSFYLNQKLEELYEENHFEKITA
ncbi:MAG: hypothetical protein MRZ79_20350 [Bacteroidia bacterium]|nr:hypothetical protein [Bacteroidia bacterium]